MTTEEQAIADGKQWRVAYFPVCCVHGVLMEFYSTRERYSYCKCPVEGCTIAGKVIRVKIPFIKVGNAIRSTKLDCGNGSAG